MRPGRGRQRRGQEGICVKQHSGGDRGDEAVVRKQRGLVRVLSTHARAGHVAATRRDARMAWPPAVDLDSFHVHMPARPPAPTPPGLQLLHQTLQAGHPAGRQVAVLEHHPAARTRRGREGGLGQGALALAQADHGEAPGSSLGPQVRLCACARARAGEGEGEGVTDEERGWLGRHGG